jgi:hypothetical protein
MEERHTDVIMELKMRISKCVEEDKMMFAVKELGCDD